MKCIPVFLLISAAASYAADFNTGQAARLIIGQTFITRGEPGAGQSLLGGVGGVAYANDTLFVADSNRPGSEPNNNRVLIFKNVSATIPSPTAELFYTQRCPACVGQADVVLGQPDFTSTAQGRGKTGMRRPTAVASDGKVLAVADTDNNRVLLWLTIPNTNGAPADVVLGQANFDTGGTVIPPNARSMRGPQGVWIQDGRLYVADTQNHRVLIWRTIPTSSGAPADIVLGQPDFTTFVEPDISQQKVDAKATNMLNPVSVTSDGRRLVVTDLGHNRVLIWNSIPNANQAPADVVFGQPDMNSSLANNSYKVDGDNKVKVLCDSTGADADGKATFPVRCNATLDFPRFALSDGKRLYIADGGNDRVLVLNSVPTENGKAADYVIGQLGGGINQASDAADSTRTPTSLAWDGTNLYVADAFNRRINIYSPGENTLPYTAVRNAASFAIYAVGGVQLGGTVKENDEITLTIGGKDYKYKIVKDNDFPDIILALVNLINAGDGDPNVFASPNYATDSIILTARAQGADGNSVEYSVKTSTNAQITATTSGATLAGGMDAAKIAPGTIVSIIGDRLSDYTASAAPGAAVLPTELANTQVYFEGVRAPLLFVSPEQINAQVPFEFLGTTSTNAWVRTVRKDGTVSVTTPAAITVVPQNPGIFTRGGDKDPRPGVVLHASSQASGTISVDGTAHAGDTATVRIEDRSYTYTVKEGDTLDSIRDGLIELINQDPKVYAFAAGVFDRIRLRARVFGPDGNGIPYTGSAPEGAQVIISPTGSELCCANVAGAPVTDANPAVPGETLIVYATGLGLPDPTDYVATGEVFPAGIMNKPKEFVSSLAGGKTANVLYAGLEPGQVGVWRVDLELNSDLPTNPQTQLTIAQDVYVSNIVSFPVVDPRPPAVTTP